MIGIKDPFQNLFDGQTEEAACYAIHIRNQKRTKKKSLTTVQGLKRETFDLKKILSDLKKQYKCNGTIVFNEDCGTILQFSGDQRTNISDFLVEAGLFRRDQIKIHGAI